MRFMERAWCTPSYHDTSMTHDERTRYRRTESWAEADTGGGLVVISCGVEPGRRGGWLGGDGGGCGGGGEGGKRHGSCTR